MFHDGYIKAISQVLHCGPCRHYTPHSPCPEPYTFYLFGGLIRVGGLGCQITILLSLWHYISYFLSILCHRICSMFNTQPVSVEGARNSVNSRTVTGYFILMNRFVVCLLIFVVLI